MLWRHSHAVKLFFVSLKFVGRRIYGSIPNLTRLRGPSGTRLIFWDSISGSLWSVYKLNDSTYFFEIAFDTVFFESTTRRTVLYGPQFPEIKVLVAFLNFRLKNLTSHNISQHLTSSISLMTTRVHEQPEWLPECAPNDCPEGTYTKPDCSCTPPDEDPCASSRVPGFLLSSADL